MDKKDFTPFEELPFEIKKFAQLVDATLTVLQEQNKKTFEASPMELSHIISKRATHLKGMITEAGIDKSSIESHQLISALTDVSCAVFIFFANVGLLDEHLIGIETPADGIASPEELEDSTGKVVH